MPNLFEFLYSINVSKENLITDDLSEKDYVPYVVNRGLSMFNDTCLYANEMNQYPHIPKKYQYSFYINSIPKRKRFSKWAKADKISDDLKMISRYFNCSFEKGKTALSILTESQIEDIRSITDTGGRR